MHRKDPHSARGADPGGRGRENNFGGLFHRSTLGMERSEPNWKPQPWRSLLSLKLESVFGADDQSSSEGMGLRELPHEVWRINESSERRNRRKLPEVIKTFGAHP